MFMNLPTSMGDSANGCSEPFTNDARVTVLYYPHQPKRERDKVKGGLMHTMSL